MHRLDYLDGKGEFPNGNPTLACHDFSKYISIYPKPMVP